jgi:hypothetical protein
MRHYNDDVQMGLANEDRCLPILETHFKTTFHHNRRYTVFDYKNENEDIWVELKSRRVPYARYPTTIITRNKLNFCLDASKSYYIVYQFEDGLYYIKYNKELFDTFQSDNAYRRSPRFGIRNNVQQVVFIPIGELTKII